MSQKKWEQERAWAASKIQIPGAADGEIYRKKLLESLESGDEDIVVFHAGAGYGKTTVMAEWAKNHRAQSCWYRLHESDNDGFRFLRGLAVSFSNIASKNVFRKNPFFDAVSGDFFEKSPFFDALSKDFFEMSENFFVCCFTAFPTEDIHICLDNFEVIKNEQVQTFLLQFMEYGAGRVKFFFTARGGFPEFLAANMMRGKVREIGTDELCFEERETAILLNHMTGEELPRQIAKNIQEYTNGWPAGVVFAGRALKSSRPQQVSALFDKTHLYHYIFYEIFRKLSFDIQQFLTDISVFETIEASVCNYALKRTDAEGILEYLVRENIFFSRCDAERHTYHCEEIFADFLRNRLPASRREEIQLRAAKYYARRGEWEEAVRRGMECGEKGCGLVASVVEKKALSMYEEGKGELLKTWVAYLCEFRDKLGESALFCIYGCLQREDKMQESLQILEEAVQKAYKKQRFELYETYRKELYKVNKFLESKNSKEFYIQKFLDNEKVEMLSVECLENFTVCGKNGELTWRTKKTKELFACLFYEEGRWAARDTLMERLWPEKPLKNAVVLFHTTVSYLRRTLAENDAAAVLLVKNQSYAIDMKSISSDIELLNRWSDCLKEGKIPGGESPDELLKLHYKGYMHGEDYVWAGVYKEHVEYRYLRVLKTLAEREKARGNFVQAVAYLEKAVAINGYEISIREIFVECLLLSGNIAGAKREYERLQNIRKELMGQTEKENFETYIKKFPEYENLFL